MHTPILGIMLMTAALVAVAAEPPALEGDAYARADAEKGTWTIGTAAVEVTLQARDGTLRLASFRNKLAAHAAEYVDPATALPPFLPEVPAGYQTEVLWTRQLEGEQAADPASDNLRAIVRKGDLIGFGVYSGGDAKGDSTAWITRVKYDDGESFESTDDATLNQGPVWYYGVHKQGSRFFEYLDTVESVVAGTQYTIAGQPIEGTGGKDNEARAEKIRVTSTYVPYREPRFAPFANLTRMQPSWVLGAMRLWRAPRDGTVVVSGRAQPAGGKVDVEIVRFREPPAAGAPGGMMGGDWRLERGETRKVNAGGRPAVQLDLYLSRQSLRATFHVTAYPGTPVLRHWVELENTGAAPVRLASPDHFSIRMPEGEFTHYWMFGGNSRSVSGLMQNAEVTESYRKTTIGLMTDFYNPWMAMVRRGWTDGWFMAPEYHTLWVFGVQREQTGRVLVSATLPDLAGYELSAGARLKLPTVTLGVFRDSFDDMGRRLYDWQYEYQWDYTNDDWYGRSLMAANWYNDVHNLQENFTGRLGDLDLYTVDFMRAIGADLLWDDAGWSESPNIWAASREGPDFAETNRHVAKSDMKWLLWFCGVPSAGIMDTKVGSWGDFQWRTDGFPKNTLPEVEAFFKQVTGFITNHPRSSFHTCSGGDRYAHTFDVQRYADVNYLTDGGGGPQTNYYFSYLDTPDKWTNIIPTIEAGGTYRTETIWQLLTMLPFWHGTHPSAVKAPDQEQARQIFEVYRYLRQQGVAGRRSYVAHPVVEGDTEYYYFQRLSHDRERSVIILKHLAPGQVTIYPRDLLPGHEYEVAFQVTPGTSLRSGADLMAKGITIINQPAGELIYLGLPGRPGSAADKVSPKAPGRVMSRRETTLGHSGIGVYWSPGSDDNFVSYHEVRRDGRLLGKVSTGNYYFDHAPGWEVEAAYMVRTVDGSGNTSEWKPAERTMDEPLTFFALGGHFPEAGREGWRAETTVDGRSFQPMKFVPPERNPGGDFGGSGRQKGGVEGYWEGAGTARCGRGWQQAALDAQCVRTWIAPRAGTVRILGRAMMEYYRRDKGAALRVRINHNQRQVWPETGWGEIAPGDLHGQPHDVTAQVQAGDAIRFVLDRGSDAENDVVAWMPRIVYAGPDGDTPKPASVVRILSGATRPYTDSHGNTWSADRYFSGGKAVKPGKVAAGSLATQDDMALYEQGREGKEFSYAIPVQPGLYTVRLLFAETGHQWSFERPFDLSINGRQVLRNFDVCQAARGPGRSYARVFRHLVPDGDNQLVLRFSAGFDPVQKSDLAMVQAIEVLPEPRSVTRIDVGAGEEHVDWNSQVWEGDGNRAGGNAIASKLPVSQAAPTLHDQRLYQTARSGRELTYKIAAAPGLYSVQLKFAELWLTEAGQRPMNIEINGRRFWTDWDPATAAGKLAMAADLRASDITPDKEGNITIRLTATGAHDAILQAIAIE